MSQPKDYEGFVASVVEAMGFIEDFGGWSKEYYKHLYGGKRNRDCVINRVQNEIEKYNDDPTEANFKCLWISIEQEADYIESLRDELQDKQDNIPESLQDTDSYWNRDEAISTLDNVHSELTEALGVFKDEPWAGVIKKVDEATESVWERVTRKLKQADKDYDNGTWSTEEWKALKKKIASELPDDELPPNLLK